MAINFINNYKPKFLLHQRHLLNLMDFSRADIFEILLYAKYLKKKFLHKGRSPKLLENKSLAMIFMRSNALARVSYEQAIRQLGGEAVYLSSDDIALGQRETVQDMAKAISGYGLNALIVRTDSQSDITDLAKYGRFSVINARSSDFHPTQALGDYLTLYERFEKLAGLKLAYVGAGGNICHSLIIAGAKLGVEVVCACPPSYRPNMDVIAYASRFAKVSVTDDIHEAVSGADAIYTTTHPMDATKAQLEEFAPFMVHEDLFLGAHENCAFMHPLPVIRNAEATSNVVGAPYSIIYQQAANRIHVQKAVLALLLSNH